MRVDLSQAKTHPEVMLEWSRAVMDATLEGRLRGVPVVPLLFVYRCTPSGTLVLSAAPIELKEPVSPEEVRTHIADADVVGYLTVFLGEPVYEMVCVAVDWSQMPVVLPEKQTLPKTVQKKRQFLLTGVFECAVSGALLLADIYEDKTYSPVSIEPAATAGTVVGLVNLKQWD